MALTPEEIEEIRKETLGRLAAEEAQRKGVRAGSTTPIMPDEERQRREREREIRRVRRAAEEEYWQNKGYQRYVTRHGRELWLTPEEIRERKDQRRSRKPTTVDPTDRRQWQNALLYLAIIAAAVLIGLQLV